MFFSTLHSFAQGFKGGISAGVAGTQVDGDRLGGFNMTGFVGGIFVRNEMNDEWAFSMAIRYFGKGSRKVSDPENGDLTYYRLRLHYAEVPLTFIYTFGRFYPEFGISCSYLINALEDSDAFGSIDPDPPFNKYDFPAIIGISYQFNDHFRLNTQYSYSIIPIRKHPGNQSWYFDRGQYNNTVNLTLNYTL